MAKKKKRKKLRKKRVIKFKKRKIKKTKKKIRKTKRIKMAVIDIAAIIALIL